MAFAGTDSDHWLSPTKTETETPNAPTQRDFKWEYEGDESFDETTSKLNEWVKTEKNFKEAALILITKLEEFRDFNGDVWDKYRKEMNKAVSIVKETSTRLGGDLENINSEFYERLNDTLTNLDQCIQRFIPTNRR